MGSLVSCNPWDHREPDMTEQHNCGKGTVTPYKGFELTAYKSSLCLISLLLYLEVSLPRMPFPILCSHLVHIQVPV